MNNLRNILYRGFALLTLCAFTAIQSSCEKNLNQTNPNEATEDTFWQDEEDFDLALTSCYTPLKNALNGGYYGTRGVMMRLCRADDVVFRNDISQVYTASRFTNDNSNSLAEGMFTQIYNALYRTNTIMQQLELKKDVFTDEYIAAVEGECLFIRGFYLFQLAKEFKDAPLKLTASQDPTTFDIAKSTQKDIWDQAIEDLTVAANNLPVVNDVIGRPTSGAALAAIGKIYMYQEEWQLAVNTLEQLTKSPYSYALTSNFADNFNEAGEHNEESIFELLIEDVGGSDVWGDGENSNSTQTNTRPREYASSEAGGWYEATATQTMMNIFLSEADVNGDTDIRARQSVAWNYTGCMYYLQPFTDIISESNQGLYWFLKYQNWDTMTGESSTNKSSINERAMRYAEVLLFLAEAYNELGQYSTAVSYINQIRARADLNDYSGALTYDEVFDDIVHQRAIEFFLEGERFYDLRRWGLLDQALQDAATESDFYATKYANYVTGYTGSINKYDYYPIPLTELQTNSLCTASEGW